MATDDAGMVDLDHIVYGPRCAYCDRLMPWGTSTELCSDRCYHDRSMARLKLPRERYALRGSGSARGAAS